MTRGEDEKIPIWISVENVHVASDELNEERRGNPKPNTPLILLSKDTFEWVTRPVFH